MEKIDLNKVAVGGLPNAKDKAKLLDIWDLIAEKRLARIYKHPENIVERDEALTMREVRRVHAEFLRDNADLLKRYGVTGENHD